MENDVRGVEALTTYNTGADAVTAFEAAFDIKVKDLPKVLAAYERKDLMATIYRVKDMPAPKITVTAMPPSARKPLLWDAADRVCPTPANAPKLLGDIRAEAAKFPDDEYARKVLARAEIIMGDEWEALDDLKAFTTAHPDDAEAHYLLGQAWYLMTMHKHIITGETAKTQMRKAREELGRAYTIDPLHAPTLYYLSRAMSDMHAYPDENAVTAAVEAHYLAPAVDEYAVYAASLLIHNDAMPEAVVMLYPLANNPHNKQMSQWASGIIDAINSDASKDAVRALLNGPPPAAAEESDTGSKSGPESK